MPSFTPVSALDMEQPQPQWGDLSTALHNILPYGRDLSQEASDMLSNIISHMSICLQSEDWAPGVLYWAKQLKQYLDLKYTLPNETRVALARVFWELAVAPGMDATMIEVWAQYCRRLINKRMGKLVRLAEEAQRFFPPGSSDEILEEFLPKITTCNLPESLKSMSYIRCFLPTDIESGKDPRDWMPALFRLWSMFAHSTEFDRCMISIVGHVAQNNVGVKDMFTQDQIRTVFSAGLSALSLPVGKGQRTNNVDAEGGTSHRAISRNEARLNTFAKFIVYTTNPVSERENPRGSSLTHFGDLIQANESFFHPSNFGQWTYALSLFLQWVSTQYLRRIKEEESPKCKTPQELRLTPELNIKFVEAIRGVTFLMMFSKDPRAVAQTNKTLRFLAWIAPNLIIPGVLERAYPSLESLTETHRTTSVISAMTSLTIPLLNREHYPQGGKHLLPLLHLTIPGVDLNDPGKTWYTLLFVSAMISTVPIRDLTEMGSAGFQWGGMEMDMLDSEDVVDMELEDSNRKATTAEFEEWVMKLLRRAILMFENFPDMEQDAKKGTVESSLTGSISYCFEILFSQLSPKLYDMTTKLVIDLLDADITGYREEIISLANLMVEKCHDRRGYKLAAKVMVSALQNLLTTYTLGTRSHNSALWNDEAFMAESHLHWGEMSEAGVDSLDWHIPSQEEINFAIALIEAFHVPALTRARELMTTSRLESKQLSIELCKAITMIKAFVLGMVTLVEDDGDSPISKPSLCEDGSSIQPLRPLEVKYCLTDHNDPRTQKIRKIRAETGQLLHDLMQFFHTKREDDVENIKVLVKATRVYLTDHGTDSKAYESSRKGYDFLKEMYQIPGDKKIYPRFIHARRATTFHCLRLKINSHGRAKTEMHDALILSLTDLSLSQYADVRKKAQQALLRAVKCYQGAKSLVIPILLKALEGSNTDYERMKGALYSLSSKALMLRCLRDWRFVPEYVLRICAAHHADKPSIQILIRKCFVEHIINSTNYSFKVLVSSDLSSAIDRFNDAHSLKFDSELISCATIKTKNHRLNNIKAYDNLLISLTELANDESLHWRYQTMVMSFMELYMRPEIPTSLEMVRFEAKSLLSDMPTVRKLALSSLTVIMANIKTRTFAQGDPYSLIVRKATNPLKRNVTLPENVSDDFTWEYLKSSVAEINYDQPELSMLDDSISTGWLAWPKTFKAYLPRTESFVMPDIDAESRPAYDYLEQFFSQPSFWEKLIEFMAQEPIDGDSFNTEHARFFKSIFGLWEDKFLDIVEPAIIKLASIVDDKNSQRSASELIGGLVRGSKHWRKSGLDRLWSWLAPTLKKAFQLCTPDSLVYWERFVKYCCAYRDPRRLLPLITLIFNTPLDKDSAAAFSESKKLFFTRAVLVSLSWRVSLLTSPLREDCLSHITHPYKQVREILGHVINEYFQLTPHPSYKSVSEFLRQQKHEGDAPSVMVESLDEKSSHQIATLVQNLEKWRVERPPAVQGASDYTNASKTVLGWLYQALSGFRVQATYGVVLPLIPELFQMQDISDDQDLQQLATLTLLQLGRFVFPAKMVAEVVDIFCKVLRESTSWHVRNNVLPVLQIFFYTNLFSMNVDMVVKVMDSVSSMLLDPQIEVRQLAASTLSGIVQCSQRDATKKLISDFKHILETNPLPVRNKRDRSAPKDTSQPEGYSEALVKRHGGVLGLSSLLGAFPYDVPKWMPEVMVLLAKYFSDPPPVSSTVKKVFADFKRTHQDTWHEDQKQFSLEELEVLSDMLISPISNGEIDNEQIIRNYENSMSAIEAPNIVIQLVYVVSSDSKSKVSPVVRTEGEDIPLINGTPLSKKTRKHRKLALPPVLENKGVKNEGNENREA
ncbi:hypothetical protein BGX20_010129 [Mortierella sp. AD010]|nr:hypothetical protein BGX20_010129 [Mortierella sp. AD010]